MKDILYFYERISEICFNREGEKVIDTNFGKCKREEIVAKDPMERGITFKDL
jgi:hypothetical protein